MGGWRGNREAKPAKGIDAVHRVRGLVEEDLLENFFMVSP
jgi:hypothetical protein